MDWWVQVYTGFQWPTHSIVHRMTGEATWLVVCHMLYPRAWHVWRRKRYDLSQDLAWREIKDCRGEWYTLNGHRYLNEIALPVVVPLVRTYDRVFQDDNARDPIELTMSAQLWKERISNLDWATRSPDLSPIEHDWDELGRRRRERHQIPLVSLKILKDRLLEQWEQI